MFQIIPLARKILCCFNLANFANFANVADLSNFASVANFDNLVKFANVEETKTDTNKTNMN